MNPYLITAVVLASLLGVSLIVLFIGGLLVRTDLYRTLAEKRGARFPRSRVLEDLRPVQNLVVEFLVESEPCHHLLNHVQQHEPLSLRALLQEYRYQDAKEGGAVSIEKLFTAMFMLGVAGLVRFGEGGISLTNVGREILARINDASRTGQRYSSVRDLPEKDVVNSSSTAMATISTHRRPNTAHWSLVKDALHRMSSGALPNQTALGTARCPASISKADHDELTTAIVAKRKLAVGSGQIHPLQQKLTTAIVVNSADVPPDLITMGSRAQLLDLDSKERINFTLVFPVDANFDAGRISIFHPLGTAMLGRRVGDQLEWAIPYGIRRFEVTAVHFQPEAALALAA